MSALGWSAGIALTGNLVSLTYGSLAAASDGHGFTYWLFPTMLVACNVGVFCVTPYALVRGRTSHIQVWCTRTPGPSGEAHSVLVVGSDGVACSVSFLRRPRLRRTPLMVQRQ